jgi:hypothetical protein
MDLPGMRYRILATRCRQSAGSTKTDGEKAALLQMATNYDRRADEIESDWKSRAQAVKVVAPTA